MWTRLSSVFLKYPYRQVSGRSSINPIFQIILVLNLKCGMELIEFRPPDSSDDLCLLFYMFLLLCRTTTAWKYTTRHEWVKKQSWGKGGGGTGRWANQSSIIPPPWLPIILLYYDNSSLLHVQYRQIKNPIIPLPCTFLLHSIVQYSSSCIHNLICMLCVLKWEHFKGYDGTRREATHTRHCFMGFVFFYVFSYRVV